MDWNFILLLFFWLVNNALMYRLGYTRAFKDAAGIIADEFDNAPRIAPDEDAVYWKTRYEELAEEFDHAVGPKSFGKELGRTDAPGETTE